MDKKDILSRVDHTLLKQTATWEQIEKLCREGLEYAAASVCIPPCYVKQAKDFVGDKLAVCTVIGFPNGNMTTAVKVFETEDAVKNGKIFYQYGISWHKKDWTFRDCIQWQTCCN